MSGSSQCLTQILGEYISPWVTDKKESMNMSCQDILRSPKAYSPTTITIIDPGLKIPV